MSEEMTHSLSPYRSQITGDMTIKSDTKGNFFVLLENGSWEAMENFNNDGSRKFCPYADPHVFCAKCKAKPCPLGLNPEPTQDKL